MGGLAIVHAMPDAGFGPSKTRNIPRLRICTQFG